MSRPRVIIIGAGIGGLALAQGLRRGNVDFAVFERDALLDSRLQGYRIKILADMKDKLQSLMLDEAWSEFLATCARTSLGETNLNATDAAVLACREGHLPEGAGLPYTADRGLLRQAMMTGIQDSVFFGKRLDSYEIIDEGVRVSFVDGSTEQGTFLVGADGSRSAVRKQILPEYHFLDTESYCIYGKSFLDSKLSMSFPREHRKWITVIRDQCPLLQSIITNTDSSMTMVSEAVEFPNRRIRDDLPPDYVHWGLLFPRAACGYSEDELNEALLSDASGLAIELTSRWHPSIRSLLELQDKSLTSGMKVYSASPSLTMWESSPHVTLLGDAVHLMSPSGGVGAVAALHDAVVLAKIVADGHGVMSIDSVSNFERQMKEFAGVCLRRSFLAGEKMLNTPPAERCRSVYL